VFGPWVLIELFGFGPDFMSLFIMIASIASIFALPIIGRWIDKFGAPRVMVIEVILFFVIYLGYGTISAGTNDGWLPRTGLVVAALIFIHTLDRVVMNFGMARSIYLRTVAVTSEDVTPTLATGMALDHIFSIASALLCGWLWWEFGPQYVFIFSGVLATIQLIVALRIK
jgi:predicted MFS family arabinose efflux permease